MIDENIMRNEINQSNLYLLIPSKISWLADMLCENQEISILEALKRIYSSKLYKELQDESTKKWHLGPVDLYQELMNE